MRSRVYKIDFNGDRVSRLCFGSGTDCGGKRAGTENYLGKSISSRLEEAILNRKQYLRVPVKRLIFNFGKHRQYYSSAGAHFPILSSGDAIGSVILCGKDRESLPGDTEKKLLQVAATYLGREMEN